MQDSVPGVSGGEVEFRGSSSGVADDGRPGLVFSGEGRVFVFSWVAFFFSFECSAWDRRSGWRMGEDPRGKTANRSAAAGVLWR